MLRLGRGEPVHQILCGHGPDVRNLGQFKIACFRQCVEIREPPRQSPRRRGAHLPDAEGGQEPRHALFLAALDGSEEIFRTFFAHAFQRCDALRLQIIEIRGGFDESGVYKALHHRGAEAVDVHPIPGGEVGDVAQLLRRAFRTGAAHGRAVRVPDHRAAALRAELGQAEGACPLRAL